MTRPRHPPERRRVSSAATGRVPCREAVAGRLMTGRVVGAGKQVPMASEDSTTAVVGRAGREFGDRDREGVAAETPGGVDAGRDVHSVADSANQAAAALGRRPQVGWELPVLLLEDSAALLGLLCALVGVGLSVLTGNGVFDGIA